MTPSGQRIDERPTRRRFTWSARNQVDESKLPLSAWAVIATLAGILAFVTAVAGIGGYIAVAAIVCGHAGSREIKNGLKGGNAWAKGGLLLGYGTLALLLIGNIVENFG